MSTLHELSEDIIFMHILTRLPAKCLVGFRCVCKSWKNTLTNPDQEFINTHISKTHRNPEHESLLMSICHIDHTALRYTLDIFSRSKLSYIRIEDAPIHFKELAGSVNGLVCLKFKHKFLLWNPATGLGKTIESPQRHSGHLDWSDCSYGFGWNFWENDYKIVLWYRNRNNIKLLPYYVYSSNLGSWTELTMDSSSCPVLSSQTPATIVNGCPYWIGERVGYKFDVFNNQFRTFLLPRTLVARLRFFLFNLADCLAGMMYDDDNPNCVVDLYRFDEDWNVWLKISKIGPMNCGLDGLSACFKYSGEILFDNAKKLYDPRTRGIKVVGDGKWMFVNGFSYTGSLMFLDGMEPIDSQSYWKSNEKWYVTGMRPPNGIFARLFRRRRRRIY